MFNSSERTVGQFPLSIATSLAFEGAIGIHPDNPNTGAKLSEFKEVWVNARTLFRNFYNAIGRVNFDMTDMSDVVSQYIEEMRTIEQIVADHTEKRGKVVFLRE